MSDTVTLQQRVQQLKKMQANLPRIWNASAKEATLRAIEAAVDATPPKKGTGRGSYIGTNTVSGELKQSWKEASKAEPVAQGNTYTTVLANNKEYASYVNDGHRMDRHFVPGLYVNPESGLLEYDPSKEVGLMVGTKTQYVKGEFMTDQAAEVYRESLHAILETKIREGMQ